MSESAITSSSPPTAASSAPAADGVVRGTVSRRRRLLRTFMRNKLAVVGAVYLLVLVLVAVFAPLIATYDPDQQDLMASLQKPSAEHYFGTDLFGRDAFSRVVYGTRVSLLAGLESVTIAVVLGTILGLLAGYMGRAVDTGLSFFSNTILSVPGLVFAIAVVTTLGPGLVNAMFAVGIIFTPRFFRLVRGSTRGLKSEPFITASVSIGCSTPRILFGHVLPNALPPLLIDISLVFGTSILTEAALSFLGLGVQPPTASWGSMLADAASRIDQSYLLWFPGGVLILTVLSFAFVADGLRDALGARRRS